MTTTETRTRSALGLLGLARRAGAVAPGTEAVRRAIREGQALLILIAKDASSVQLEKIRTTLHDRSIPQAVLGDRNTLGAAIGFARLTAVAITDRALADRLVAELEAAGHEGGSDAVEA
ncbi:MAG: L7Ae/L30e/S12e/Gadd45 family ribosomal protein [Longimicrobiales bacterium]|nr:L7Ae/L30e/S12e/Gadd45 family ribosomal protein [Longimicrobiales bacterium]